MDFGPDATHHVSSVQDPVEGHVVDGLDKSHHLRELFNIDWSAFRLVPMTKPGPSEGRERRAESDSIKLQASLDCVEA